MRLLDLFCGAGGAAVGYHRAGFTEIVGVDIKPQPRYPFTFVQADALEYVEQHGHEFDAIHASPPCQLYTAMRFMWNWNGDKHPDLVGPTREALIGVGCPWVIENVPPSPLRRCLILCGSQFGLGVEVNGEWYELRRHRVFESSVFLMGHNCRHREAVIGLYGDHAFNRRRHTKGSERGQQFTAKTIGLCGVVPHGRTDKLNFSHSIKLQLGRIAMDMPWAESFREITEAIPPAYTEYIGHQLLQVIEVAA